MTVSAGGVLLPTEDLTLGGNLTLEGGGVHDASISSQSKIGYGVGAGGAVTQITSATTAVVLNALTGEITTVALTNLAGVDHSFTLTNDKIAAGDVIVAHTKTYGGTADGIPVVKVQSVAAGSCILNVNNQGAVALDALMVISFAIIKGQVA